MCRSFLETQLELIISVGLRVEPFFKFLDRNRLATGKYWLGCGKRRQDFKASHKL